MKNIYLILLSVLFVIDAQAQHQQRFYGFNDSIALSRNNLAKHAMITLGSWAAANIASGFILAGSTHGEAKYAWSMNAYWNFFNLGLAGLGYVGMRKAMSRQFHFSDNYMAQHAIEKLYIFNAGLDLAYIAGGFYLRERGNSEHTIDKRDKFKGYGTSIIAQGGFLLLMDVIMYTLHHQNTRRMDNKLQQFEINASPGGLGISYNF